MFLQADSGMKGGQFGYGNGYSNRTLFLFSRLEFPAEWPAGWRERRCKETWGAWDQFWPGLDVWPQVGLCACMPPAYRGVILSVCLQILTSAKMVPGMNWTSKQVMNQMQWTDEKGTGLQRCLVTMWVSLPSLDLTTFMCERRGLDKTFRQLSSLGYSSG